MSLTNPLTCPLCGTSLPPGRGIPPRACPTHGGFVLIGDPDADPGVVHVSLERWSTSQRYPVGVCTPDEWLRLAGSVA